MITGDVLPCGGELEDGELSEESVYIPLERPSISVNTDPKSVNLLSGDSCQQEHNIQKEEELLAQYGSSSSDSSDSCSLDMNEDALKKKRTKIKIQERIHRSEGTSQKCTDVQARSQPKKYDVWTAALFENTLTEDMHRCDVSRRTADRNVENYDVPFQFENRRKRCIPKNLLDNDLMTASKRSRRSSNGAMNGRSDRSCSSLGSDDGNPHNLPRDIPDLQDMEGRSLTEVAAEIALKLNEDKVELFEQAVQVLGTNLPMEIYKETQQIENVGGMMIQNGKRRRTPGGVFLYLLKQHPSVTPEQLKDIFCEDRRKTYKSLKTKDASISTQTTS